MGGRRQHDITNASSVAVQCSAKRQVLLMSTVSAAQAVGEYLQSPDDLMKIASFRKKLEKEKASIDAKLRSGVREQLDATREGLRKLLSTRENVSALREEIRSVEALFQDDKNDVKTFDQISRVSFVRRAASSPVLICSIASSTLGFYGSPQLCPYR